MDWLLVIALLCSAAAVVCFGKYPRFFFGALFLCMAMWCLAMLPGCSIHRGPVSQKAPEDDRRSLCFPGDPDNICPDGGMQDARDSLRK